MLNKSAVKPGILCVLSEYAKEFRPKSLDLSEHVLTELYEDKNSHLSEGSLLELCQKTFSNLKISSEEATKIDN